MKRARNIHRHYSKKRDVFISKDPNGQEKITVILEWIKAKREKHSQVKTQMGY